MNSNGDNFKLYSLKKIVFYQDEEKNRFATKEKLKEEEILMEKFNVQKNSITLKNENELNTEKYINSDENNSCKDFKIKNLNFHENYYLERKIVMLMDLVPTLVANSKVNFITKEARGYFKIVYMIKIGVLQNYLSPIKNELENYRITKEKDNKIILEKKNFFPGNSNESTNKYVIVKFYVNFKDIKNIVYINKSNTMKENLINDNLNIFKYNNNEDNENKREKNFIDIISVFINAKKFNFKSKILNKKYLEKNGHTKDAFDLFFYRFFNKEFENMLFHFPVFKINFTTIEFYKIFFINHQIFKKYISVDKEKLSLIHIIKINKRSKILSNFFLNKKNNKYNGNILQEIKILYENNLNLMMKVYDITEEDLNSLSLEKIIKIFLTNFKINPESDCITFCFKNLNESIGEYMNESNLDYCSPDIMKDKLDFESKILKLNLFNNEFNPDTKEHFDINFIWVFLTLLNERVITYWEIIEYFKLFQKRLIVLFVKDKYILFLTLNKILQKRFSQENMFGALELQDKIEFYYAKISSKITITFQIIEDSNNKEKLFSQYFTKDNKSEKNKNTKNVTNSMEERDVNIKFNNNKYFEAYNLLNLSNPKRKININKKKEDEIETFRITLTPQIINFLPMMKEKTNRIMRNYSNRNNMIRVAIRDSNSKKKFQMDYIITKAYIKYFLKKGIQINNLEYDFFGYSNSQFRSMSCWLVVNAEKIRNICGDFDSIKSIAKWGARLGQTLSSTYSGYKIEKQYVLYKNDFYTNNKVNKNKKKKIEILDKNKTNEKILDFETNLISKHQIEIKDKNKVSDILLSDGCGYISYHLANEIRKFLNLDFIPSCYQARFGGNKGVWSLYRTEENFVVCRDSQKKFNSEFYEFEVCEYSRYRKGHLNRQIIILLKSLGAEDDIFFKYLTNHSNLLKNEKNFSDFIRFRKIKRIVIKMLEFNINYQNDLFLFTLLKETQSLIFRELTEKSRIFVDKSVLLKGIVDEYNLLEENQVFAFISKTNNKSDNQNILLSGKFIVTRCPCLHPGDIRIFQFVNFDNINNMEKDELILYFIQIGSNKHVLGLKKNFHQYKSKLILAYDRFKKSYLNVIVFPSRGGVSHPNQMAGGDLDGDDYFIFFDEDLVNQIKIIDPYTYPSSNLVIDKTKIEIEDIIDHFVTYNSNNILGKIANLQLAIADKSSFLSNDQSSIILAELFSRAVDAPKTGETIVVPKKFINSVKFFPHYMEKPNKYTSTSILGILHDKILKIINKENKQLEKIQSNLYSFSNDLQENFSIYDTNTDIKSNNIKSNSSSFCNITFNPEKLNFKNNNIEINKNSSKISELSKLKNDDHNIFDSRSNSNQIFQSNNNISFSNEKSMKKKMNHDIQFSLNSNLENAEFTLQSKVENLLKIKNCLKPFDYKGIFSKIVKNNFIINPDDKEQMYYLISVIECIVYNKKFYNEISDLMNRFEIKSIGELFSGNISDKNEIDIPNDMRDNIVTLENYLNKIISNLTQSLKIELGQKKKEYEYKVNYYFKAFPKACAYYNTTYFAYITEHLIRKNENLINNAFYGLDEYYNKRNIEFDIHNLFDSDYINTSDQNEDVHFNLLTRKEDYRVFMNNYLNIGDTDLINNNFYESSFYIKNDILIKSEDKKKLFSDLSDNHNQSFYGIKRDLKYLIKNPNYGLPWIIFYKVLGIISDTINFST